MDTYHPEAVLKFMSRTSANRLVPSAAVYSTPYGDFIREIFGFVWRTPTVNAGVKLESKQNPACITLRFVQVRLPNTLGIIPPHKEINEPSELFRRHFFRFASDGVKVHRAMLHRDLHGPEAGWQQAEMQFATYAEALADTMFDFRTFRVLEPEERGYAGFLRRLERKRNA